MNGQLPPGITLVKADDYQTWLMDVKVIDPNPIYLGETYRLKFHFSPQYPIEVLFLLPPPSYTRSCQLIAINIIVRNHTLTHIFYSHQKSPSSATSLTRYHCIHTSTPMASSVSTSSIDKAGHQSTMWRACASACKACSRATPRGSDRRAMRTLCGTTHSDQGISISCFMTTKSEA